MIMALSPKRCLPLNCDYISITEFLSLRKSKVKQLARPYSYFLLIIQLFFVSLKNEIEKSKPDNTHGHRTTRHPLPLIYFHSQCHIFDIQNIIYMLNCTVSNCFQCVRILCKLEKRLKC